MGTYSSTESAARSAEYARQLTDGLYVKHGISNFIPSVVKMDMATKCYAAMEGGKHKVVFGGGLLGLWALEGYRPRIKDAHIWGSVARGWKQVAHVVAIHEFAHVLVRQSNNGRCPLGSNGNREIHGAAFMAHLRILANLLPMPKYEVGEELPEETLRQLERGEF